MSLSIILLNQWEEEKNPIINKIALIVCDIKKIFAFKDIYRILHTSLSGAFNKALVEQVGAFASKFEPNSLAEIIIENFK